MTEGAQTFPKAFAVWFKDLSRWDAASFHGISWHWPKEVMASIGSVLEPRKEKVNRKEIAFSELQPITIHFDGSIDPRKVNDNREYSMELYKAHPGDVVVAKIDLKNGAVGIVPDDLHNVVVTSHFAVYKPDLSKIVPEYFHLLIQTSFFKSYLWRNKVGAEGRKEVKLDFFEAIEIPLPAPSVQQAIVERWQKARSEFYESKASLRNVTEQFNTTLFEYYYANCKKDILNDRWLALTWAELSRWDAKSARAAAFRISNPTFKPLGEWAEESTELVKPWTEPEKEWPVYGVNNKAGVVFSHYQPGKDFNAAYKRIRKDWFFHNPTRSAVGSLGIVPDVPVDAITSPEYQVWRIKEEKRAEMNPEYVAVLINTPFFINLIQFHRVGAVKQRLYVDNLLEIPIPVLSLQHQELIVAARQQALLRIATAEENLSNAKSEVEAIILGTKSIEDSELAA